MSDNKVSMSVVSGMEMCGARNDEGKKTVIEHVKGGTAPSNSGTGKDKARKNGRKAQTIGKGKRGTVAPKDESGKEKTRGAEKPCYQCGKLGHTQMVCKYDPLNPEKRWYQCGKLGHIRMVCKYYPLNERKQQKPNVSTVASTGTTKWRKGGSGNGERKSDEGRGKEDKKVEAENASSPERLEMTKIEAVEDEGGMKEPASRLRVYGAYFGVEGGSYQGYKPVSPRDFEEEDLPWTSASKNDVDEIDPGMLRDNSKSSKSLLIFAWMLSVMLLLLVVWQFMIGRCLVTELCETNDRSSDVGAGYLFKTFDFRVPTWFVWTNLVGGTLGLLVASIVAFFILRSAVGSARMVATSTLIRKKSVGFLGQQSVAFIVPFTMLFILLGVKVNWETAGCFGMGALLGMSTELIWKGIGSRGSVRAAAVSRVGFGLGMQLSFGVALVVSLSMLGISLFGVSTAYLVFSDVRALGGFAAGAATSALFLRLSGCVFGASLLRHAEEVMWEDHRIGKKAAAHVLASYVQRSTIMGPDWFYSNVSSILATAMVASSLPFYSRDSFATCVYNHLAIDQECGPFGKSKALSHAVYICRNENLYLSYPNLTTESSVSVFIGVPFLLALVGLLTSIVCATMMKVWGLGLESPLGLESRSSRMEKIRKRLAVNTLVGGVILVVCFAAICFGLFGPSSSFASQRGFGSGNKLQRMILDGGEDGCVTRTQSIRDLDSPLPIPSGGRMIADEYRPVTVSGRSLGRVSSTGWRLFLCSLIGLVVAFLLSGWCGVFFALESFKPVAAVEKAALCGTTALIVQSVANGMMCSMGAGVVIVGATVCSFVLYDAYGVGIMTVAYMSMGGVACTAVALGGVVRGALGVCRVTSGRRATRSNGVVPRIGFEAAAIGESFLRGASVMTGLVLILAALEQAGLQLSPKELVGGPEQPPLKLIRGTGLITFDVFVWCGLAIGIALPMAIAGTLCAVAKQEAILGLRGAEAESSTRRVGLLSLVESMLPFGIALVSPFVVGFGLGNRAVIAMAASSVFVSFVVGSFLRTYGTGIQKGVAGHGTKRTQSMRRANSIALTLCEMVEPAMRSVSKVFAAVSVVSVSLMRPDSSRGWIGGVLLGVTIVCVCAFIMWKYCAGKRRLNASTIPIHASRPVSPYYVESPTFDPRKVVAGSQMSEALHAFGHATLPVSPQVLPGLSRRSRAEFTTVDLEPLSSPRVGNPVVISTTVLPDDTGRTPRGN